MSEAIAQELQALLSQHTWQATDVLSIEDLSIEDCQLVWDMAEVFHKYPSDKLILLKGVAQINYFLESSTRTQSSFELAGKQMGADVINVKGETAAKKKENFVDIAQTLDQYKPQLITVRTDRSGLPLQMSRHTNAHLVNAGDGWHEHPSQALIDGMTLLQEWSGNSQGKIVTIIGDVKHSRVFGSLVRILAMLDVKVRVCTPLTLLPEKVTEIWPHCELYTDADAACAGADAIYALRIQNERGAEGAISTLREYSRAFGVTLKRMAMANSGAIFLHAGPVQRDIDSDPLLAARHPQSRVLKQVENGLAVRKSLLYLLAKQAPQKQNITRL
jgi:aspartate carbamoyltransferase catalytic subunit